MSIGDIFMLLAAISLGVVFAVGTMTLHKANKSAAQKAASTSSRTPAFIPTSIGSLVVLFLLMRTLLPMFCSTPIGLSICAAPAETNRGTASGTQGNKQVAAAFLAYHQGIEAVWDRAVGSSDRSRAQRISARAMQELGAPASLWTAAGVSIALAFFAVLARAGFNRSVFAKRWYGWPRIVLLALAGAGVATPLFGVVVVNLVGSIFPDLTMPAWYMGLGLGLAATLLLIARPMEAPPVQSSQLSEARR